MRWSEGGRGAALSIVAILRGEASAAAPFLTVPSGARHDAAQEPTEVVRDLTPFYGADCAVAATGQDRC